MRDDDGRSYAVIGAMIAILTAAGTVLLLVALFFAIDGVLNGH